MFTFLQRLANVSEGTRLVICRLAFLFGCLLPTLLVLSWCASHYLPGRAEAARRQLADRLGLEVELAEVRYPRPGVTSYLGLQFADPELGARLITIGELEITAGDAQATIRASQVEIIGAGGERLWQWLHRRLCSRSQGPVRLRAEQVAYRQGKTLHWLTDVQARIEPTETGMQAVLAWRQAGVDMQKPHRLGVVRDRSSTPPSTQWQLETGETPLPCSLAAALLPSTARLGETSSFRGSVWAQQQPGGWVGAMAGQFTEVDLQRALSGVFPHPLSGKARLTVERATFRQGRVETLQAAIHARGGDYGRSLVTSAVEYLDMRLATQRELLAGAEPYHELGLRVNLDRAGLSLAGLCSSAPGAVLVSRWGPVLGEPAPAAQPVTDLLKMVSPGEPMLAPISLAAAPLARVLPLPDGSGQRSAVSGQR